MEQDYSFSPVHHSNFGPDPESFRGDLRIVPLRGIPHRGANSVHHFTIPALDPSGFEPLIFALQMRRSNQLNYGPKTRRASEANG